MSVSKKITFKYFRPDKKNSITQNSKRTHSEEIFVLFDKTNESTFE